MLTKKESIKNEVKTSKNLKTDHVAEQDNSNQHKPYLSNESHHSEKDKEYDEHFNCSHSTHASPTEKKNQQKTRLTVKCNVGYGNQLYIRGKGANLTWEKGIPLKNIKADEWCWETDASFNHCEFKVLLNDRQYENGANHHLNHGSNVVYTPHF